MEQFHSEQNNIIQDNVPLENMPQNNIPLNNIPLYHSNNDFEQIGISPKKIVSYAAFALFVLAATVLAVQTLIEVLVRKFKPEIVTTDWYIWALTAVSLVVIGFPIYYLMINRIPDSPKGEVIKLKPSRFFVILFIGIAAMYITSFFSSILTIVLALIKGEELINPAAEAIIGGNFFLSLIYAAIIAPIFEELIFRKLLLNKLRRFGDIPAILMTGIAFGMFHMNLSQMFYATVLGFIFAYVAIRTNTVKYSIIMHMIINFIATIMSPLISSGKVGGIILIYVWISIALTVGTVFFLLYFKNIRLEKSAPVMKVSSYFLNLGTILYTLICLVMIVVITVI